MIAIFLFLSGIIFWVFWNGEKLKQEAISTIRAETGAILSVRAVDLTLVSFPSFTLRFDSVVVSDSNIAIHQCPVLKLEKMELKASLFSFLLGSVSFQSIRFCNGEFRIWKNADSTHNFMFFNNLAFKNSIKEEEISQKRPFQFAIKKLEWENIKFDFNDSIRKKHIALELRQVHHRFITSDSAIHFTMKGDIFVDKLAFDTENGSFVSQTLLTTDFKLIWNSRKGKLYWTGSRFLASNHPFEVDGHLMVHPNPVLDLRIKTKGVLQKDVLPMLTEKIGKKIALYEAHGPIDAEARISGEIKAGEDPKAWIGFEGLNQKFVAHAMEQDFFLKHFKGFYSNQVNKKMPIGDQNSRVVISHVEGFWHEFPFVVSGEVADFENPWLVGFLQLPLEQKQLAILTSDFPIQPFQSTGWIKAHYDGPINDLVSKSRFYGIENWKGDGRFQVKSAKWKGSHLKFKNLDIHYQVRGDVINVFKMNGELNGNRFTAFGKMEGLTHHIAQSNHPVEINMDVHSRQFNINPLITVDNGKKSPAGKTNQSQIKPGNIDIKLALKADKIRFRKLDGSHFSANLDLKNDRLDLRNMQFRAGGGIGSLQFSIQGLSKAKKDFNTDLHIQNVGARALLLGMNQFGQDVFKPENIEGKLDLKGKTSFQLDENFNLLPASMSGDFDLKLKEVKLINFKPLTELSGFLFPKESLQKVELANLDAAFHLKGKNLLMEEFELPTSLATFFIQGEYDFDNHLDMNILVPIHTISRKNHNQVVMRGLSEKSKPAIPLKVWKKNGKVEIGLDKETARKRFWKRVQGWGL